MINCRALFQGLLLAGGVLGVAPDARTEDETAGSSEPDKDTGAEQTEPRARESTRRATLLELGLDGGAFSRTFEYADDLFGALRPYELEAAGFVALEGAYFPIGAGDLRHIGVTGRYEHAFPPVSETRDGRTFDTRSSAWQAGLTGRLPLGDHELGAIVAYGRHDFEVSGDEAAPLVPDVDYEFLRLAVLGRLNFDELLLGLELGDRLMLGTGELEADVWFPRLSAQAIDVRAFVGYRFSSAFSVIVGAELRRYAFSMNPRPEDARVAGGALDQYIAGFAGLGFSLEREPEPKNPKAARAVNRDGVVQ